MPGVVYMAARISRRAGGRPDARERLVGDLALDQRQVELARLEERDVLRRALRIARLHFERRVDPVDGLGHGLAVDGEAAAGRRCSERDHDALLGSRESGREQEHRGARRAIS